MTTPVVRDPIEYLLNAMEHAGQMAKPAEHGYGPKRRALLDAIVELREQASKGAPPVAIAHEAVDLLREWGEGWPNSIRLAHLFDKTRAYLVKLDATTTASDRPVVRAERIKAAAVIRRLAHPVDLSGHAIDAIIDYFGILHIDAPADRAAPPSET